MLLVLLRFLKKIMIMYINLNCLRSLRVSPIFNISDLRFYLGEEDEVLSRTTSIQEWKDEEDITMSGTITPSIKVLGPIMISRAQRLNRQVNSFLCSSANDLDDILLPIDLIAIKN
jgi:hypothetical protein